MKWVKVFKTSHLHFLCEENVITKCESKMFYQGLNGGWGVGGGGVKQGFPVMILPLSRHFLNPF